MEKILLYLSILLLSTNSYSEVYKWVDESGKVHYSDKKPNEDSEEITIKLKQNKKNINDFKYIVKNQEKYEECVNDLLEGEKFEEYKELCDHAAIKGMWYAQYKIGNGYYVDRTLKFDVLKAVEWLESSSTGKYKEAMYNLGLLYAQGNEHIQRDIILALELLKQGREANEKFASKKIIELELELKGPNKAYEELSIDLSANPNSVNNSSSNVLSGKTIPSYNNVPLGIKFSDAKRIYGDKLKETNTISYSSKITTIKVYRLNIDDISANWMTVYFYQGVLYRISASYHSYKFEAAGRSEGLKRLIEKRYNAPSVSGKNVKQSTMYGMYVPWNHEAFRWNFDDKLTSILLMSSNEHDRASIQFQINEYENKVENDVKKQLKKKALENNSL